MNQDTLQNIEIVWKSTLLQDLRMAQQQNADIKVVVDFVIDTVNQRLCHEKTELLCEG